MNKSSFLRWIPAAAALSVAGASLLLWFGLRAGEAQGAPAALPGAGAGLASVRVESASQPGTAAFDGVVQAVRQTVLAAQVSGAVVALDVRAGDVVKAGQLLVRLDSRAAQQSAAAGDAQVRAARAGLEVAQRDFERQRQLLDQKYISQAAFDRAEAQYKTAQAEASAQLASAGAARTQTDFYVIRAPYAGVVSEVSVVLGDMAMPGRPLVTIHDPAAMRVSAAVPETVTASLGADAARKIEVAVAGGARVQPQRVHLLPAVDPVTHTREMWLDLPPGVAVAPGMFARVWLGTPGVTGAAARLFVPQRAVLRRAELNAVYVIGADGRPLLRQVRLGRTEGDRVEVLSGISEGERIALDPHAAAARR